MCMQYTSNDFQEHLDECPAYEVRQLYYDREQNVLIDEGGYPIIDIFRFISPNDLFLFKKNKEYMIVRGKLGDYIELIYPNLDFDGDEMYF